MAAVQAVLEEAGVNIEDVFGWGLALYDQALFYYDTATSRATLGHAPSGEETDSYGQIYSDRLTGGTWRADVVFRDAEEARRMASFNQAYLAALEAEHALAYHYAVNPTWDDVPHRPDPASVHGQELLADRVAAAFLATVFESYPRADGCRPG